MNTKPIKSLLKVGDKLVQTQYAPHVILEVFRVDNGHIMLMTEGGEPEVSRAGDGRSFAAI
jgi:hypothetical protein